MPTRIEISPDLCIRCGSCVEVCPAEVFDAIENGNPPQVVKAQSCITCGHCVAVCPEDAISHSRFPASSLFSIQPEMQLDAGAVLNWMQTRRSVREFTRQPVPKEKMQLVLKAARSAPVASNFPTTRYTLVQTPELLGQVSELTVFQFANEVAVMRNWLQARLIKLFAPKELAIGKAFLPVVEKMIEQIKSGEDPILHHATLLMLFHGSPERRFANDNAQLACQNAALMCHTLGLGAFYTGYLIRAAEKNPSIARLLDIPARDTIFAGLAIVVPAIPYYKGVRHTDPQAKWV
jgi:NAD-dependent dihydropyrimidine dehydrogenase PreA subunit/nitroreductase